MKIVFIESQGRQCPKLVCDVCSRVISKAKSGLVKYNPDTSEVVVSHKGPCDGSSAGGPRTDDRWPWQSLDTFLVYLARNMEIDFEEASDRADWLGSI